MKRILTTIAFMLLLIVPMMAQEELNYPIDTIEGKAFYRYRAEKSVGLYRVGVKFGVTQAEIIELNPQLKERGLHLDEELIIPVRRLPMRSMPEKPMVTKVIAQPDTVLKQAKEETMPAAATPSTVITDTTLSEAQEAQAEVEKDTLAAEQAVGDTMVIKHPDVKPLHIALLLPFLADNTNRDVSSERFMEFYEGCLLALRSMQGPSHPFDLKVLDTGKGEERIREWCANGSLDHMDAIIGLAYPMQASLMAQWCKEHQIPLLLPFTANIDAIHDNPYLYQFNSSHQQEAATLVKWLQEQGDKVNCVLIDAKEADIPAGIRIIRQAIKENGIPYTTVTIRQILSDSVATALVDNAENIIIFNTEKYSNIQVLLPRVIQNRGSHRLTLFSHYSWSKEKILLPTIHTSLFTTDHPVNLQTYEETFRHYFQHGHISDLPRYDLLGYDVIRQFVGKLHHQKMDGLQSQIHFERISEQGGYINTHLTIQRHE